MVLFNNLYKLIMKATKFKLTLYKNAGGKKHQTTVMGKDQNR